MNDSFTYRLRDGAETQHTGLTLAEAYQHAQKLIVRHGAPVEMRRTGDTLAHVIGSAS